jgi:hypothetical protein
MLAAIAVALRVSLFLILVAMAVGMRSEIWAVLTKRKGWRVHLTTAIFFAFVLAGAIISSVNIFPDAGWHIDRTTRLAIVNIGLAVFLVATLSGLYRRAMRSGPEKARAAFLTGVAMCVPGIGLVWLLTEAGAHG